MHLKTLEIQGFKSFAAKTTLRFLPPTAGRHSLTAIVGPNGSGKSNIADAIRWVMGEQSMKTLRGKKSDDIIFSGSDAKGKMGLASVALTLDNQDHRLPLEYDEVVIARRVDRSGESEYLVNGNPVRLFDLQVLLAQAQFGHGSYSVIGQGMIDRLLLQTPAERKEFFDEACGIKEFQIKRHQAELKLARTREHMTEAEMLLGEITPRLKTLSRQVKKLEERQAVEERLRELQAAYYTTLWESHERLLARERQTLSGLMSEGEGQRVSLRRVQEELARLAGGESRESVFQALQREYQALLAADQTAKRERDTLSAKMQTAYERSGAEELSWLVARRDTTLSALARAAADGDAAAADAEKSRVRRTTAEAAVAAAVEKRGAIRSRLAELDKELARLRTDQGSLPLQEMTTAQAIVAEKDRFRGVFGTVADLATAPPDLTLALDVAAGSHLSSVVVADDLVAERCIEYLRSSRQGIATFLPLRAVKPRTLPHNTSEILKERGVIGIAKEFLSYDPAFEAVFSFIFGGTVLVEDIETARRLGIGRIRMVTRAGDVIETSGAMKGGYRSRGNRGMSFAARRYPAELVARLAETERSLETVREQEQLLFTELEALERAFQAADRDHMACESRLQALAKERDTLARESDVLGKEYDLSVADPEHKRLLRTSWAEDIAALDARTKDIAAALLEAEHRLQSFHREEEEKKQRVFVLQNDMQRIQAALNMLMEQKNQKQVEIAKLETRQEDITAETASEMREQLPNIVARTTMRLPEAGLASAHEEIQTLKYKLSLIGGIDAEVMTEYQETRERHGGLTAQLDDLRGALHDLGTLIEELETIMKKKRTQMFRDIRKEFARYFAMLFDGGKADVVEVYGEDTSTAQEAAEEKEIAETREKKQSLVGIDVVAHPPGKKISHLQALSGGERTMTSMALLCAILHTNPAPFVVLDEVEAALDEANTMRFGHILQELAHESQFILITHNRATMHIVDALYGVTMGADGMSRLVSVQLGG